jgi:hypothetical protein
MTPARGSLVPLPEREHGDLDVSRLRQDMLALWREEGAAAPEGTAVTRACLSTLVVPDDPGSDGDDLVTDLLSLRPSRAIRIRTDPGMSPRAVDAWVSGACFRRADKGSLVCSEVVHLTAGRDAGPRLASAVRSLRVGGVPLFVVAPRSSPAAIAWLDGIDDVVDAVLADSGALDDAGARALWRRAADGGEPQWGDLQWESLQDWRRAIASWFDRPAQTPKLAAVQRVAVETTNRPGSLAKALLLTGWLASRLGWSPGAVDDPERLTFTAPAGARAVTVTIRPRDGEDDPSLIRSVTVGVTGAAHAMRWRRLAREGALAVEEGGAVRFRLNRTKVPPAATVLDFLRRGGTDPVAAGAMRLAARLGAGA